MDVLDVYYVGGFGVMGWVAALDYSEAQSDPLVQHKSDIMQHMNADYRDALILLAKRFTGIEAQEAEMTSVDRLGFLNIHALERQGEQHRLWAQIISLR